MKQKLLLKQQESRNISSLLLKMFMLLAVMLGGVNAVWAQDEDLTFNSSWGAADKDFGDGTKAVFTGGSYSDLQSDCIVLGAEATLTITAKSGAALKGVKIYYKEDDKTISFNDGSQTKNPNRSGAALWTTDNASGASSVAITCTATASITKAEVYYVNSDNKINSLPENGELTVPNNTFVGTGNVAFSATNGKFITMNSGDCSIYIPFNGTKSLENLRHLTIDKTGGIDNYQFVHASGTKSDAYYNFDRSFTAAEAAMLNDIVGISLNVQYNECEYTLNSVKLTFEAAPTFQFKDPDNAVTYDFKNSSFTDGQPVENLFSGVFSAHSDVKIRKINDNNVYVYNYGSGARTFTINNVIAGDIIKMTCVPSSHGSFSINSETKAELNLAKGDTYNSEQEIRVQKDGSIVFTVPRGGVINKIIISSSRVKLNLVTQQSYKPTEADEGDDAYVDKLLENTTGLTPTFSSSNDYVASYYSAGGYFILKRAGYFNVVATVQYNGETLTTELPVSVHAATATYVINGNTYKLTGAGLLESNKVTEVPKIIMTYGTDGETPLVTQNGTNYQAKVLDANGWPHVYVPEASTKIPTMGTYYKFEAKGTGKLTVIADCGSNAISLIDATDNSKNQVVSPGSGVQTLEFNLTNNHTYYLYANTANTPDNANGAWDHLQLQQFTFVTKFKFKNKAYVYNQTYKYKDANGTEQTVAWGDPYIADIDHVVLTCYGNVTADVEGTTGRIQNVRAADDSKPMGGAIVVTAYNDDNENDYYVVTVPYEEYEWNFKNNFTGTEASNNKGITFENDANGVKIRDWGVTYEVRSYDEETRKLYYLNEPVLTPNVSIAGNNAAYIGQTAGLMFEATPKKFGLRGTGDNLIDKWTAEHPGEEMTDDILDGLLKQMLAYKPENINKPDINCAAMEDGAVLRIPSLKAGTFVAIKFFRHAPGTGDNIKLTNVKDLRDWQSSYLTDHANGNIYQPTVSAKGRKVSPANPSELTVQVVNQTNAADVYASKYGWLEFQVKEDGDVTIEVTDGGWTHIKKIAISPKFINTDLRLSIAGHTPNTRYALKNEPGGSFEDIVTYDNTAGNVHSENGKAIFFSLENVNSPGGADAIRITDAGKLTANYPGTAYVVEKVYNNNVKDGDALVDIEKTYIVITAQGNTQRNYPYTWDFTTISSDTQSKLTNADDWTGDATNGFKPTTTSESEYLQNSELCYNIADRSDDNTAEDKDSQRDPNKEIKEFYGLGFLTGIDQSTAKTSGLTDMTIKPNTGLVVSENNDFSIVVPDVTADSKVYVRTTNGGTVTLVSHTEDGNISGSTTSVQTASDGTNDKLYSIPGNGGDVEVSVSGTTVEGIAVTNIYKECKFWDNVNDLVEGQHQFCYHSDSHDIDLDYPLTKYYTDIEMKAYVTTSKDGDVIKLQEVTVVPAYEGLIVRSIDQYVDHPLFKPAINTEVKARTVSPFITNWMQGFPNGGTAAEVNSALVSGKKYYGFTNVYQMLDSEKQLVGNDLEAQLPGFYQLFVTGTLGKNRALLALPESESAKVFTLECYNIGDATGIMSVNNNNVNDGYYSITGVKLQGKPSQRGIYILNGKKVNIK